MLFRSVSQSRYNITTEEEQWNQVNSSCLLAYLGIRGFANIEGPNSKIVSKNALPILAYYDNFKNYYANTQEKNFYIIGNTEELIITINGSEVNPNVIPSHDKKGQQHRNDNHKSKHNKRKRDTNQSSKRFTNRTKCNTCTGRHRYMENSRRRNNNNNKQNPRRRNMVYSKYTNNKQNNTRKLSTRKPRHNQG